MDNLCLCKNWRWIMSDKKHLENQIEETRVRMYAAYMNEAVFRDILIISQQLDYLLNKLENISK
ncbi:Spo0E family sporulation regulatory protein-aspartic acid phosphatase [Halobacillus halophilus]|uniref:Spo0E like sporulation regulatory protein n=2 Tax=Halobacillus halophilus TaxID=1570 RepID=I0JKX9_HALH3|nr:Spo0E family sporulation regulatory protein-aspartic acid phosphatase [Halobacillus halophilus]CCG44799.1 hypothetical protein HBHAL_2455 [Halobacillus halophilus DSM 2266]